MKLTWLGGQCLRLHVSGQIYCFYPNTADSKFTQSEILGGVDEVINSDTSLRLAGAKIRETSPHRRRLIDEVETHEQLKKPEVMELATGQLVLVAQDEAPLVLSMERETSSDPILSLELPRDLDRAILLVFGAGSTQKSCIEKFVAERRVKQIIIASAEISDEQWHELVDKSEGTPMQMLELGLALEV